MSSFVDGQTFTAIAGAAIAQFARVKFGSDGKLTVAGIGDYGDGILTERSDADGDIRAVRHWNAEGTFRGIAAAAIQRGAWIYTAASGNFTSTAGAGRLVGKALASASGNGAIFPFALVRETESLEAVTALTADAVLTAADSGRNFTTVGATGTVTVTLPAAQIGMRFGFRVGAVQELRIDPNTTEKISLPSTGAPGAAGKYLTANADGETVVLLCTKAGEWSAMSYTGTWTAEP